MAFKIIAIICISIVVFELLGVIAFFICIATADNSTVDNYDGKMICAETGNPCIYTEITPIDCDNCPARKEAADELGEV